VIDGLLGHSPAEHVRRPAVPPQSPTLGFTHLQFEALLTTARESPNPCDFALVAMLGLLGLRIFEATGADIGDLGDEHGHRVLRVCGKGTKTVLIPLPPAVGRAIDRAIGTRARGPILLNSRSARMDRHAATRRLRRLAEIASVPITRPHPHMLRHTFVTSSFNRGMSLEAIAALLGHRSLDMTLRYAKIASRTVADEYFAVTEKVEALYGQPAQLPADAIGPKMARLRREHHRLLGNGWCTRPPQLDCAFESICETCSYFQTSIEFRPTLQAQHDHAAAHDQTGRQHLFAQLLNRIDDNQAS
jgi:Phage integrase family